MDTINASEPLVAIGMPVYNGERWLRESLESLLNQSFEDFSLFVCDNASTDDTGAIVREYAARDSRVHYHRNEMNIGVYRNYDKAFSFSRSKYFKWASANDLCAPSFLQECVEVLESDSDAVLVYPGTMIFQLDIKKSQQYQHDPNITDKNRSVRFKRTLNEIRLNNAFNGVILTDALRCSGLNRVHARSDVVLLAELALTGAIRRIDKFLFYRRMDPSASSSSKDSKAAAEFFSAESRDIHRTPQWDYFRSCIGVALTAPIPWLERLRCLRVVLLQCIWDRKALWREFTHRFRGAGGLATPKSDGV